MSCASLLRRSFAGKLYAKGMTDVEKNQNPDVTPPPPVDFSKKKYYDPDFKFYDDDLVCTGHRKDRLCQAPTLLDCSRAPVVPRCVDKAHCGHDHQPCPPQLADAESGNTKVARFMRILALCHSAQPECMQLCLVSEKVQSQVMGTVMFYRKNTIIETMHAGLYNRKFAP